MNDDEELDRVRAELDRLVKRRARAGLTLEDQLRYRRLAEHERDLLRERRSARGRTPPPDR